MRQVWYPSPMFLTQPPRRPDQQMSVVAGVYHDGSLVMGVVQAGSIHRGTRISAEHTSCVTLLCGSWRLRNWDRGYLWSPSSTILQNLIATCITRVYCCCCCCFCCLVYLEALGLHCTDQLQAVLVMIECYL